MDECLRLASKCKSELRNLYYDGMMKEYAFDIMDGYLSSLIKALEDGGDGCSDGIGYLNIDSLDCYDV